MFYKTIRVLAVWLARIVFKIQVVGKENVPPKGVSYIMACNHRSNWDPLFIVMGITEQIFFMAKEEFYKNAILSWFFTKLGAFPVARGKGDTGAIDRAQEIIREGKILGIFPEGTRSKSGEVNRPKSGVALIAMRTNADVLPCAISFEKLGFRKKVTVSYGPLITYEEMGFGSGSSAHDIKGAARLIMDKIVALTEDAK